MRGRAGARGGRRREGAGPSRGARWRRSGRVWHGLGWPGRRHGSMGASTGRVDDRVRQIAARRGVVLRVRPVVLLGSGATIGAALGLLAGGVLAVLLGVAGAAVPLVAVACWPDQRAVHFEAQVPEFLEAVARSLRAGRSLARAMADAALVAPRPLAVAARALVLRMEAGVALRDVVRASAAHTPSSSWRTALVALGVAHDVGGPQAMVLDSLAASMRARQAAAREMRALAVPVRLSATVIAVAPLVVLGGVAATDPEVVLTAVSTPPGAASVAAGVVLDVAGFWWIRALTRPR